MLFYNFRQSVMLTFLCSTCLLLTVSTRWHQTDAVVTSTAYGAGKGFGS